MKYTLIERVNTNSSCIILSSGIRNRSMLNDDTIVDKVENAVEGHKQPVDGWKAYDGRVLATSGELYGY